MTRLLDVKALNWVGLIRSDLVVTTVMSARHRNISTYLGVGESYQRMSRFRWVTQE